MRFTKIEKVLKQSEKNYKLEEAALKYKLIKLWDKVVLGFLTEAKDITRAVDFKNGVLTVAVLSSELASQIKAMSQRIIYELNSLLGKKLVFSIQIEY